jgi:hypothetical protein
MLPLLAEHGTRWIATDEGVLGASTHGFVSRDSRGHVRNPDQMYRPYKVAEAGHELGIVFRDHALSDMIGFHYQRSEAPAAAQDFVRHLQAIGQAVQGNQPALVSVILDGENCWEHYPDGGVGFLRALYEITTRTPGIRPVQIGEFLQNYPPRDTLPHLFAGSWISHNFAIWIGHEEDNTAWDALHQAREHLKQRTQQGQVAPDRVQRAWDEIYIAEGSDWYWWFGDDHSSAQDALFDYLFRKHLQNVYVLLGDAPPPELSRPISKRGQRVIHTQPRAFLRVRIDGRHTFFEWVSAGRYTCQNERGTMAMVARGAIKEVYFGFNPHALLIRVDFQESARTALAEFDALRIGFLTPPDCEVVVADLRADSPRAYLRKVAGHDPERAANGQPVPIEVGIDRIVEMAVPFEELGVEDGQAIQFFVELVQGGQSRDRAPREEAISLTRPSPDFEQQMWDV